MSLLLDYLLLEVVAMQYCCSLGLTEKEKTKLKTSIKDH
jgi:hypothetical protein